MRGLLEQGLGKMDWQDNKKSLDENPNTMYLRQFYKKFTRELRHKKLNKAPVSLDNKPPEAISGFYDRSKSAVPREAQIEATDELK